MIENNDRSGLTRRQFVSALSVAGLSTGLAACQVKTSSKGDVASAPAAAGAIKVTDTGAKLPKGNVTIRWMSGGPGSKSFFFKAWFPVYHKKHPNLTVAYDELPNNKMAEVLPLQLRNGKADDVFQSAGSTLSQLVDAGEVAPLDDIIPNFTAWKKNFPFGVLVPGVNQFNGKTYAIPANSSKAIGSLLLYNTDYLHKAGYDPSSSPLTWDEFRTAAKKITKQGSGQYYGFLIGGNPPASLGTVVGNLAQLAGAIGGGFNWKTGQYNYEDPHFAAAIELLLALKADGSLFPGWTSLSDQQARSRMPQGSAGMMLNGAWNYPVWKQQFPQFSYGVARQPVPAGQSPSPLTYAVGGGNGYSVYAAKAPANHKTVAGDLLYYLGTPAGQKAWAALDGSADPAWSQSAIDAVRHSGKLDKHDIDTFALYDQLTRLAPSPLVRNPENAQVELALKPLTPNLAQVAEGILNGQVRDIKKALRDLDQRAEASLSQAIVTATKKGARVSRDDWKFPNWDPHKDYTKSDY